MYNKLQAPSWQGDSITIAACAAACQVLLPLIQPVAASLRHDVWPMHSTCKHTCPPRWYDMSQHRYQLLWSHNIATLKRPWAPVPSGSAWRRHAALFSVQAPARASPPADAVGPRLQRELHGIRGVVSPRLCVAPCGGIDALRTVCYTLWTGWRPTEALWRAPGVEQRPTGSRDLHLLTKQTSSMTPSHRRHESAMEAICSQKGAHTHTFECTSAHEPAATRLWAQERGHGGGTAANFEGHAATGRRCNCPFL